MALGGGPEYSTDLRFDDFAVVRAVGAPHASICTPGALADGMPIVGVPCGLDVPGLAFDLKGTRLAARQNRSLCIAAATAGLELQPCSDDPAQSFVYDRAGATVTHNGSSASPWHGFTPGQGVPYGSPYAVGHVVTSTQIDARTLQFELDGKPQGRLRMPAPLPSDAVGCVATCEGATTIRAVGSARFNTTDAAHGADVHISADGSAAAWPEAATGSGCNQVALLSRGGTSFAVSISAAATFIDIGWCSPSVDPSAGWASAAVSGWIGSQGPGKAWIYRSSGAFKASDGNGGAKLCLEKTTDHDRGSVRAWDRATLVHSCPGAGGSVFYDAELGFLRTAADTTGMCFGACF